MSKNIRGSEWRKWDLHVHTPCSIEQHYGGDTPENWEEFLTDLENLPPEFGVIGINDYLFLDGYRKVLDARKKGRLSNIDLVLPVIELRLDKFGSTDGEFKRINLHVIFSDKLSPDLIQEQFLSALSTTYTLSPKYKDNGVVWQGVLSRQALTDLGNAIIDSSPPDKLGGSASAAKVGFHNLNVNAERVFDTLQGPYFADKVLTAVGKAEWDKMRWTGSAADKKTTLNAVDFVFVATESASHYVKAREALESQRVNAHLLDCSDAHSLSSSTVKDKIGNCLTWLKATPTFEGLQHIRHEWDARVHVGDEPEQLRACKEQPTKFIRKLSLQRLPGKVNEQWFHDVTLEFNTGLVAVIGNKGSGKSALADILGLLGNSRNQANASFLTSQRFNEPKLSRGKQFQATITWASQETWSKLLSDTPDPEGVERVKYIPQNFFEVICTELSGGRQGAFHAEIKDVIFSHVPESDRLDQTSLDNLINHRTIQVEYRLKLLRGALHKMNEELVSLEEKATKEYRQKLENQRLAKVAELAAHDLTRPKPVEPPTETSNVDLSQALFTLKAELAIVVNKIKETESKQASLAKQLDAASIIRQRLDTFGQELSRFEKELTTPLKQIGISYTDVVEIKLHPNIIEAREVLLSAEKAAVDQLLNEALDTSLVSAKKRFEVQEAILQDQLDAPGKAHEAYLTEHRIWLGRRDILVGTADKSGSLKYIEAQLDEWGRLPVEIQENKQDRKNLVKQIHEKICSSPFFRYG